jgi:SWI/SNF-related matrix-associated actin-dependent regulator of chromatin subfamily A member 5
LDGSTDLDEREEQIEEFTKKNSNKHVFLISTRAGGLGINLMTANIVVLYDSDWNPQIDLQAMDRAHRIGQKKPVSVFRFITQSTIEEKMIEKQALKLKLDSVIIQRGRAATKSQGFSKDELKDVVNYGADEIFKIGDTCTEDDIEEMIKKGFENATDLKNKVDDKIDETKFDLINFEMKPSHYYDFEDEDYLKKRREEAKKVINENVVKMLNDQVKGGRREKGKAMKSLNETHLFPNLNAISSGPKKKKINVQDYKFFSEREKLKKLLEKEQEGRFDSKLKLTDEEREEKDKLLATGFNDWDRREYFRYIQALEMNAPDDYAAISEYIQTKTPEECEKYGKVLFERMSELSDANRIKSILEKTSKLLEFKSKAPELIARKIKAYEDPYEEMTIYPTQKSKFFSKESDVILLCLTHKYNYGNWAKIKKALRNETKCRFDHLLLSRTEKELQRRVDILVKGLEKELKDESKKKNQCDKPSDLEKQKLEDINDGLIDADEDMEEDEEEFIKEEKAEAKSKKKREKKAERIKKEAKELKMTKE